MNFVMNGFGLDETAKLYSLTETILQTSEIGKSLKMVEMVGPSGITCTLSNSKGREENSKKSYVTSHRWCKKSKTIELSNFIQKNEIDDCNEFVVMESYKGVGPNYADLYYLIVELRDQNHKTISRYESGILTCFDSWKTIVYSFRFLFPLWFVIG